MLWIAYLDEFGHIGPFVHRSHEQHKTSPVFGLGGVLLPSHKVRHFATWFFKLKNNLLAFEIARDNVHPAKWEKKGAALYTTDNVLKYRQLRIATNRLLNHVEDIVGHVFYVGVEKDRPPHQHNSRALYRLVLMEAIKRLNEFCAKKNDQLLIIIDEQEEEFRSDIVEASGRTMFGTDARRCLIEPPIQAESHLYQTLQCADWICGLVGRYAYFCCNPLAYQDLVWTDKYFAARLRQVAIKSGILKKQQVQPVQAVVAVAAAQVKLVISSGSSSAPAL